jgi:uncharacterized membrane protein YvbJ
MTCPHCGSDNPVGKNFCGDCGTALENRCPQCGASLRPTAKFCDECGVEIRVLGVRVLAARGKTEALRPNTSPKRKSIVDGRESIVPAPTPPYILQRRSSTAAPPSKASANRSPCSSPT